MRLRAGLWQYQSKTQFVERLPIPDLSADQIIALETRLNAVVYEAFRLMPDEIALIEKATKYPYGAV